MFNLSRRSFCKSVIASAAASAFAPANLFAADGAAPNLRFGVVSDVHITSLASTDYWEKTLRWYDAAKVDAVMVAGDIADWGLVEQLQNFATAWYKVFPNDKGADGRHVEKVFVCGNHDHEGFYYVYRDKEKRDEAFQKSIVKDRKAAWDLCFHEEFQEIYAKQVKGYTFIGGHWGFHQNIEKFMDEYKSKLDPNLPFFYAQHPHPKDTIYGPWAWGHDNGASTRAFSKTPNAIVFTGHSHYPLTDESGIWQDTFTSIGTASLRYIGHRYNRENSGYGGGPVEQMPRMRDGHSKHGLLVSVFDDHIDVARRDFQNDESLGDDWILPLPLCKEKPYAIPPRAVKARENLPTFAADAGSLIKAEDVDGKDRRGTPTPQTIVTFPTALAGGRAFDYEIQAELNYYDVTRVFCTKRVFAPDYFRTTSKLSKEGQCIFARVAEVPEHVDVRFVVTPLDCYGNRGKSIYSKKFKLGEAKK